MATYACCEQCGCVLESTVAVHVIRDCRIAHNVWIYLVPYWHHQLFFSLKLKEWLHWNLSNAGTIDCDGNEWQLLFSTITWFLWKQRNDFVLKKKTNRGSQDIVANVVLWAKSCVDRESWHYLACVSRTKNHWQHPEQGWIKLNVDGSVSNIQIRANIGGVLRDNKGQWITGFSMHTGMVEITRVEALAILEGLQLA